ncbi:porin [Bartonella sp. B30(2025)]
MSRKEYLIIASAFAFISTSVAQAADIIVPYKSKNTVSSVIISPAFSWTGFYLGGQIGGFSGRLSAIGRDVDDPFLFDVNDQDTKWFQIEKKNLPELSGFIGGVYAGANVDIGQGFILGFDTDVLLSEKKGTQNVAVPQKRLDHRSIFDQDSSEKGTKIDDLAKRMLRQSLKGETSTDSYNGVESFKETPRKKKGEKPLIFSHTVKQKWVGATRVRIGYSSGCLMSYISGGIAYGHFQNIISASLNETDEVGNKLDDTKAMAGYTLGAGVDFAVTNNIILRAEYRYSDFGKKKFSDIVELDYKMNDFRVGIAYKF